MASEELPIVLRLWAIDTPNSGVDTRGAPDEAATVIKALVEALTECADDLEQEVTDRWGYDERLSHKLARDLTPVVNARALIARLSQ